MDFWRLNLQILRRRNIINFASGPGQEPEARLVVFYAGHGYTLGNAPLRTGWLVPADAPNPEKDVNGFVTTAVNIRDVLNWSELIQSKHVLWIFDSCFSGNIVEKLRAANVGNWRQFLRDGRVRRVVTSGSALQKVPDKSMFAERLINALKGIVPVDDGKEFFTGQQLSQVLKEAVITARGDRQTPQLGTMDLFGPSEGDIVFNTIRGP
jgi:hypothetical protein